MRAEQWDSPAGIPARRAPPELATALAGIGVDHETWGSALIEAARWAVMVSKEA